jgi:hypothetical protein
MNGIIYLNYQTPRWDVLYLNLMSAGAEIGAVITVNQRGIASAINRGLFSLPKCETYTILANDIIEPGNWLKMRLETIGRELNGRHVGICSIPFAEVHEMRHTHIVGNYTISRALFERIGGMDTTFDPYGAIDLDYCQRADIAKFATTYVPGAKAQTDIHLQGQGYGFNKVEEVRRTWHIHETNASRYVSGEKSIYINGCIQ